MHIAEYDASIICFLFVNKILGLIVKTKQERERDKFKENFPIKKI